MNSELKGAGCDDGRTTTTGLLVSAEDTTTVLKDFPLVGHGGVLGSPVTHRRGRQRGQAKAAVAPAGLAGNRYAILVEARGEDKHAGDAGDEDCAVLENPGVAKLIPQAEEAPAAPQGAYSQEHSSEGAPAALALQKATPQQSPGAAERTLQAEEAQAAAPKGATPDVDSGMVVMTPAMNRRGRRAAAKVFEGERLEQAGIAAAAAAVLPGAAAVQCAAVAVQAEAFALQKGLLKAQADAEKKRLRAGTV